MLPSVFYVYRVHFEQISQKCFMAFPKRIVCRSQICLPGRNALSNFYQICACNTKASKHENIGDLYPVKVTTVSLFFRHFVHNASLLVHWQSPPLHFLFGSLRSNACADAMQSAVHWLRSKATEQCHCPRIVRVTFSRRGTKSPWEDRHGAIVENNANDY